MDLPNVRFSNMGSYTVAVTDQIGSNSSQAAILGLRPQITVQPQSQSVSVGATVSLNVSALGTEPLRYRWLRNRKALPNETNAVLTLMNVQGTNAGVYSVSVSHQTPLGVVGTVSSNATLTVSPGP